MSLYLSFVSKAKLCLDYPVSPARNGSLAEKAQRVSQFWRHLTPAAFECSFKVRLNPPSLHSFHTHTHPRRSSISCPPAFCGVFPPHVCPCCPPPLTPPPCCTACSVTPPARRSEIELDSLLTPARAPEQETKAASAERRQPAWSLSGWSERISPHVEDCRKGPPQIFSNCSSVQHKA